MRVKIKKCADRAGLAAFVFVLLISCAGGAVAAPGAQTVAASAEPDFGRGVQFNWATASTSKKRLVKNDKRLVQAKKPAAGKPVSAWAVSCSDRVQGKFTCTMTQNIVDQKTRRLLVRISVQGAGEGKSNAMLFRLFHGVYLPAGLKVAIDKGRGIPVEFQKSDRSGVYAALPLKERVVARMKRGTTLGLNFQINKGKALDIAASLKGFSQALDRINSLK